ncbi:MAG: hypothetical protein V3U06_11050 [Candidatus Binatia bacterium]
MLEIVLLLVIILVALLWFPRTRGWLLEQVKTFSDSFLIRFFLITSQFGKQLTEEGKAEQKLWRERRLRDLQGLALRSRERYKRNPTE